MPAIVQNALDVIIEQVHDFVFRQANIFEVATHAHGQDSFGVWINPTLLALVFNQELLEIHLLPRRVDHGATRPGQWRDNWPTGYGWCWEQPILIALRQ